MDSRLLWIWLSQRTALTHGRMQLVTEHFDSIEAIYKAGIEEYSEMSELSQMSIVSLCNKSLEQAEKTAAECDALGIRVLTCDDPDFPARLRELPSPVHVLYSLGTLPDWESMLGIAVVGTRNCDDYGRTAAARFSAQLASKGITIISGMARGIDSHALAGAMEAGGDVIAVMGRGLDAAYPPENAGLMQKIIGQGCALSEYPPGTPPTKLSFPERNRIVCGIADGVLAVEAPVKSGTLITANLAAECGRKLFAVPGSVFSSKSVGTNNLLKRGAVPVTVADDIINEFAGRMKELKKSDKLKRNERNNLPVQTAETAVQAEYDERLAELSGQERAVAELLIRGDRQFDEIAAILEISAAELNGILPMLEIEGIITKLAGNRYRYVTQQE